MKNIKNFSALTLVHISGYLIPFLMLPYLARVFEPHTFGQYVFYISLFNYFILIVDWGFGYSAVRDVTKGKDNLELLNNIFWNVVFARVIVGGVLTSIIYFISIVLFANDYIGQSDLLLIFTAILFIMGNALFSAWFYQGIEKLITFSLIVVLTKVVVFIAMVILVKSPNDLSLALMLFSLSWVIPSIVCILYLYRNKLISKPIFNLSESILQIKKSTDIFISSIATTVYTSTNVLVTYFISTPTVTGQFGVADRLKTACLGMYTPIKQLMFPKVVKKANDGEYKNIIINLGLPFICLGLLAFITSFYMAENIILWVFGEQYSPSIRYFQFFSLLFFIIPIAIVFGHWVLLAGGFDKKVKRINVTFAMLHVIHFVPLAYYWGIEGIILSLLITETLIAFVFVVYVYSLFKRKLIA